MESRVKGVGVADVVELAINLLVDYFEVGEGGGATGAPVDDALATVDEALVVEVDEGGADGSAGALVKGEAFSGPVAGGAEALVLLGYGAAILADPLPDPFDEGVPADFLSGLALLDELPFNDDLGGDACVVGAREPEGGVAHHAVPADEGVLGGGGKSVAEVKLAGDVGRGHDDDEGLLAFLDAGFEVAVVHPGLVDAAFDL